MDAILDSLEDMARDAFPRVYDRGGISPLGIDGRPAFLARTWEHPRHQAFLTAASRDPDLGKFFEATAPGLFLHTNTGAGWRVDPKLLAEGLLSSAARLVVARGRSTDDRDSFLQEVRDVLTQFRRLLRGESDEALVVTAFEGLSFPQGARISTPWGSLRPAHEIEGEARPFLDGGRSPTFVMETVAPLRLRICEPGDFATEDDLFDPTPFQRLEEAQPKLALGLLLALPEREPATVQPVWRTVVIPGQVGSGFGGPLPTTPFSTDPGPPLTGDEVAEAQRWSEIIEVQYDSTIQVAVRRLLSAIGERVDPEGALIDAVVVWENLFGHGGTTEVGFRVTTALTQLLEPEPTERRRFRAELSKVYDLRSRVVHGHETRPKDRLQERAEKAIAVAVTAMRLLFASRPDLIPDRERGMRLILGY